MPDTPTSCASASTDELVSSSKPSDQDVCVEPTSRSEGSRRTHTRQGALRTRSQSTGAPSWEGCGAASGCVTVVMLW